jgi:Leucine-rich repeat (LRR) protein
LYLSDNSFRSYDNIPKPVKAPLARLDISKNRLDNIPTEFGILENLIFLNISNNRLKDLTPQSFSPFCHLESVSLHDTSMKECDCEIIVKFLIRKRQVDIASFYCDASSISSYWSIIFLSIFIIYYNFYTF